MISIDAQKALLDLVHKFVNSGDEGVNLAHLLDLVDASIPDRNSQDWKDWSKYMEQLNETWVRIHKENEDAMWPEPPLGPSGSQKHLPNTTVTGTPAVEVQPVQLPLLGSGLSRKDHRDKLRAERKVALEGGGSSSGVGPARQPKSGERRKGGKPRDTLINDLVLEFDERKPGADKPRIVVYCLGCDRPTVGRDANRIRAHAKDCNELAKKFPTLYGRVCQLMAERAHSTKLEKMKIDLSTTSTSAKQQDSAPDSESRQSAGGTLLTYMNPAKVSETQRLKVEFEMFRMFICCALPWALMNNEFFVSFVMALSPNFVIPDRSAFFPKHLGQEIAAWDAKFKEFLEEKFHLTFSFDGWSTRAKDELYTFHTTTPKRQSFFTDEHVFRGVSVTGKALFDVGVRILTCYGATKYSAVAGDGGPNVRAAKIRLSSHFPWIVNIYDPCHNLNLFMKDVGKLFKEMLSTVSGIANYFGKSNYGTFHLDEQRKKDGVAQGIQSHSETRFSSSYYQVVSVYSCMVPIKKCIQSGALKFETAATKKLVPYIQDGPTHFLLMSQMTGFINLLSSGANAILTLEGENTTCADVFYVWICIAYHLEQVLASPTLGLTNCRATIIGIYNHRFQQMMTESSHMIFLLAYYLHPLFRHYGGLQLVLPILPEGSTLKMDRFPHLFKTLLTSTLKIFQGEQLRLQDSGKEVVPQLIKEFTAYAYNKEPFRSHPWSREVKPLKWWSQLARDSNARLLAKVAVKIFSISPSEICDERTASRLGWFNAVRRNTISPEHLINSAKLYGYYVDGFSEGKSTHSARVRLSTVDQSSTSAPRVHTAPSLLDLVNTDNVEPKDVSTAVMEEWLFNHPDPYDLEETERVDDALKLPPVIRSSHRFDISEYVKLDDPKLIEVITNIDIKGPGASLQKSANTPLPTTGKPGEWDIESFLA